MVSVSLILFNSCSESIIDLIDSKRIEWTEENSIVCYGNSLTKGVVNPDSTYPIFLGKKLKIDVVNKGKSGATSQYGVEHLDEIFIHKPVLVLLEFGANDYFNGDSIPEMRDNLVDMIDNIINYGSEVAVLNFGHPEMIDCLLENSIVTEYIDEDSIQIVIDTGLDYVSTIGTVATDYDLLYEDYLFEGISCDTTMLTWDGLHPNGKGNIKMAENIFLEFHETFKISGMLKD